MFKSLYSKLAIVLLVLFILVGLSVIVISLMTTDKYQQEINQKLNREIAGLIVDEKLILKDDQVNRQALDEIFHMLMVINPSIELYLLDAEGKILAFSAEPGKVKRQRVDLGPVKKWISGVSSLPLVGDDPRSSRGKKVFTAARIPQEGPVKAYLYIILGGEIYDSIAQKIKGSYILRSSIVVIVISILIALIAGLLIFSFLTRRLKRLTAVIDRYESGVPSDRLDLPSVRKGKPADEIDRLGETFRKMAGRINQQIEKVEESDAMRRELIANISHDLRTPLANLQGYIETLLLKNGSLADEERRHYLQISIQYCERLNTLIEDLFELAKLDARNTVVNREPFSMGELVQDVVQKFTLKARKRNVGIVTNISRELPFVNADIALIERVLENLLDNALRHTPEEGSVSIVMNHEDGNIAIQVRDTGEGIPQKDLPRIFDRFYQLDRSRRGASGHSGLGLSITKKILELHETDIRVESSPGSGTNFTFTLPAYHHG
jgi:signal transduction histidine kinase